jgi:hypothetical protein
LGATNPTIAGKPMSNPYLAKYNGQSIEVFQVELSTNVWQAWAENLDTELALPVSSVSTSWQSSATYSPSGTVVFADLVDNSLYGNRLPSALYEPPSGSSLLAMNTATDSPDFLVARVSGKRLTNPCVNDDYAVFNMTTVSSSLSTSGDMLLVSSSGASDGICGVSLRDVPEPSTFILLAIAGIVAVFLRRRK